MSLTTIPQGIYHSLALRLTEDELEVQSGSPETTAGVCWGWGSVPWAASRTLNRLCKASHAHSSQGAWAPTTLQLPDSPAWGGLNSVVQVPSITPNHPPSASSGRGTVYIVDSNLDRCSLVSNIDLQSPNVFDPASHTYTILRVHFHIYVFINYTCTYTLIYTTIIKHTENNIN